MTDKQFLVILFLGVAAAVLVFLGLTLISSVRILIDSETSVACPATVEEAAALYGGPAQDWVRGLTPVNHPDLIEFQLLPSDYELDFELFVPEGSTLSFGSSQDKYVLDITYRIEGPAHLLVTQIGHELEQGYIIKCGP